MPEVLPRDATDTVVGFARTLRAAGVPATTDRLQQLLRALDTLDASSRDAVYWAGRLTLCSTPDDLDRYDRAFAAYFSAERPRMATRRRPIRVEAAPALLGVEPPPAGADAADLPAVRSGASATEVLRHRDFAQLGRAEREQIARWLAVFDVPGELRRTRRYAAGRHDRIDRARTVRDVLHAGGEATRVRHEHRTRRPRRVVLLVDVSGSMAPYASALLRFAHAASRRRQGRTEVFTVGTRLTRVTRELRRRDADAALAAVSAAIPDWSGGTRLGELLKEFCDRWGQRGIARGAVVVVLSDGWERGDAALLAQQMERLHRLAHRVVWANPRKGRPGYAPLAAGMAAALPHVDDFVEGHNLSALERLAAVVAGAARRPPALRPVLREVTPHA